ncbi:MAG: hypothetical protein ACI9JM_000308 [Halioglobus sp.]|jgi:hypothetical protein
MTYLTLGLLCIIAVELFLRLPVLSPIKKLINTSQKATKVLSSSHISDHWKEKVLQRYSFEMAKASLRIGVGIVIIFSILTCIAYLMDMLLNGKTSTLNFAMTTEGIVIALLASTAYVYLRKRFVSA